MKTLETILNELPCDFVNKMGKEAITSIYNFYKNEAGFNTIEPNDFIGWRKYYSIKECCEELGLTGCKTWDDVTEFFPVYDMMSDGAVLVAVD